MRTIFVLLVRGYQWLLSPRRGVLRCVYYSPMFSLNPTGMAGCRQIPSCSDYCVKAVSKLGLIKGLKMSFIRIINCR